MRKLLLALLLFSLCGCDQQPSLPQAPVDRGLSVLDPSEQVQALIFEDLAARIIGRNGGDKDVIRLFLCHGEPEGDVSPKVLAYVARAFPSARQFSQIAPREEFGQVREIETNRIGVMLRIQPFSPSIDRVITIEVEEYSNGTDAEGLRYRVQHVNGEWKILDRATLWVS